MIHKALIAGCGALGNEVIKNLVLMGVDELCLVDFDVVEQGNLTRSVLYRKADVGQSKVKVARCAILELNPNIKVTAIDGNVCYDLGLGWIRWADVVFSCLDSRWARYCLQRLCLRAGKTMIDGGILQLEGTARMFVPQKSCYACSLGDEALFQMQMRMPCSGVIRRQEQAGHAPTTPIIASVIGAIMVQEALKHSGAEKNLPPSGVYYDGSTLTFQRIAMEAWDDDCPLHDQWTPIAPLHGISPSSTLAELFAKAGKGTLLLDQPFVTEITHMPSQRSYTIGLPANKVEGYILARPDLRCYPLSDFRQHELNQVSDLSDMLHQTLSTLGIPQRDVVRIDTPRGITYFEID